MLSLALVGACVAGGAFTTVLVLLGNGEASLLVTRLSERLSLGGAPGGATAPASVVIPRPTDSPQPEPARPRADHAAPAPAKADGSAPARTDKRAADTAAPDSVAPAKPTFDIVRVAPSGSAVVAGRAAPDAEVVIAANGTEIGRATADGRGDWVFVPPVALEPGGRELTLAARGPDGVVLRGDAPVVVIVPGQASLRAGAGPAAPASPTVVLLTPPDAPPRLLQQAPAPGAAGTAGRGKLALDVVDYDEQGDIRFAGGAPAGAVIRVYIDEHVVGDTRGDPLGRWTLTPTVQVEPGDHRLRVDQLAAAGRVAARIELPFARVKPALMALSAPAPGRTQVVVQPGQSLWQLARRAYGQGVRYTVIYAANQEQIRDPDRIYPGQVFAVPTAEPDAAKPRPASSSSVR